MNGTEGSGEGGLWPSADYRRQVERLEAAVGRTIYLVELPTRTPGWGVHLSDRPYELLGVLDFPRPDPARGLAPHLLLLDDGRGINLGRILRVTVEGVFAPRPDQILYQDRALIRRLLEGERRLSPDFAAERSRMLLARLLGKGVEEEGRPALE